MLSYHNDPDVKAKYEARFAEHRRLDQVIQGESFYNGRGCFVGCTLDDYDHDLFPIELGWPVWLARLADTLFEGQPKSEAPQFGTDLLASVPIGVDLDQVEYPFVLSIQRRIPERIAGATTPGADACIKAVEGVIAWLENPQRTETVESAACSAARSAACLAARSAACSAARLAARSAEYQIQAKTLLELVKGLKP